MKMMVGEGIRNFPSRLIRIWRETIKPGDNGKRMFHPEKGERFESFIIGEEPLGRIEFRSQVNLGLSDTPLYFQNNFLASVGWQDREDLFMIFNDGEKDLIYINLVLNEVNIQEANQHVNGSIQEIFPEMKRLRRVRIEPKKGIWFDRKTNLALCLLPLSGVGLIFPQGRPKKKQRLSVGGGLFWGFYDSSRINIVNDGFEAMNLLLIEVEAVDSSSAAKK
jgi:hypothetical protein